MQFEQIAKKVVSRLRDEGGLGDRVILAREAANLIEAILMENEKLRLVICGLPPAPEMPPIGDARRQLEGRIA